MARPSVKVLARRSAPALLVAVTLVGAAVGGLAAGLQVPLSQFAAFLSHAREHCRAAPAPACVDRAWAFADQDGDGVLSLREVDAIRAVAEAWVQRDDGTLPKMQRDLVQIGLWTVKHARLERVFANFDADGDGALRRAEVLADVRLDERPLGAVLADPAAVDWPRFAARFGEVGFLITDLLPPSHREN